MKEDSKKMSDSTDQPSNGPSPTLPLLLTVVAVVGLVALLVFTTRIEEDGFIGFLAPYKDYFSIGFVTLLGLSAVQTGTKWVFAVAQRRTSSDVAGALRIIGRVVGYGLIFSFVVSVLTDNAAAALTMGSFAGLVAGYGSQTVIGNTVAGLFIAIGRPIQLGDNVTISGNSGTVVDITLMHVVLDKDDQRILIPSSNVVSAVLVKHKTSH